jgi:hypothetical protein
MWLFVAEALDERDAGHREAVYRGVVANVDLSAVPSDGLCALIKVLHEARFAPVPIDPLVWMSPFVIDLHNVELSPADPTRLADIWYGVVTDMGLFVGDLAIERCPNLHWVFHVFGKRNTHYQWSVLMGFKTGNPKYSVEPMGAVAVYGCRGPQDSHSKRGNSWG